MHMESIVGNVTDKEEEQMSDRMIQILVLLLLLLLLLPLLFCSITSNCRATLALLQRNIFCSMLCVKAPIGFNYFPSVTLLCHSAKLPHVKGAL